MTSRRMFLGTTLGAAGAMGLGVRGAWADEGDLIWQDTFPAVGVGGRPAGWGGICAWRADGHADPGAMEVADTSATAYAVATSPFIPVGANQWIALITVSRATSTGTPTILVEEFDEAGVRVATQWLNTDEHGDVWAEYRTDFRASRTTTRLRLRVYAAGRAGADKTGTIVVDSITLREGAPPPDVVVDGWGNPVPVTDVVDIIEELPPEEFWGMFPPAAHDPATAARSVWSLPLLRRHYFTVDPAQPATVKRVHAEMPVLDKTFGVVADVSDERMRKVVAADIRHRPIVTAHPWTTGTYSNTYYPRRMHDHLNNDFLPATSISSDPELVARRAELLAYMHFSQFTADGDNGFTQEYYPDWHADAAASGLTRRWAGGWDYLFDWSWLDGYGYRWQLHEPDHHVGSQMAQSMVRAYEITGDRSHLDAAQRFVWHQLPRYGFHSGVWQGRTYYWTEYDPTGEFEPHRDATDNVVALCAMGVAMVGHHTDDRRMLEMARGMVWYCVREWVTDGRWYYDGAENPLNQRRSVSHDMAVLPMLMTAIAYLIKSGVVLDREIDVVSEAYDFYLINYEYNPMAKVRYGQLTKLPAGPTPRGTGERLVGWFTANQTAAELTYADPQPAASGHRGRLRLVVSAMLAPERAGEDWRPAPGRTVETFVTAAELAAGVAVPLATAPADVVRFVVDHRPTRPVAVTPSLINYTDATGEAREVTASVPDPDVSVDLTEENYAAMVTRATFGVGEDLGARVRRA
ncbi:hypothetical protein ACQBAU_01370 [Propionibacteriaceae bacterium Y2011]